jgi:hypothetical protein
MPHDSRAIHCHLSLIVPEDALIQWGRFDRLDGLLTRFTTRYGDRRMHDSRSRDTVVDCLIILTVLGVIYFRQIFLGVNLGMLLPFNDTYTLTKPAFEYTARRFATGELPIWNPYWYAGYPHFAVPSNAVLYPATLLFSIFSFDKAFVISVLVHSFILAIWGYWFGLKLTSNRLAGLAMGVQCMVIPLIFSSVQVGHLWSVFTLAWAPLGGLCLYELCRGWKNLYAYLFVLSIVLMVLGGDLQSFSYILLWYGPMVGALLILNAMNGECTAVQSARLGIGILGLLTLGVSICGVLLLPGREFLAESIRKNGVSFAYMMPLGFPDEKVYIQILKTLGPTQYVFGRVSLSMAILAILLPDRKKVIPLALVIILCTYIGSTPQWLYEHVIQHLPVYGAQRGIVRIRIAVAIVYYAMVCIGMAKVCTDDDSQRTNRFRSALVLMVTGVLVAIPILYKSEWNYPMLCIALGFCIYVAVSLFRPFPTYVTGVFLIGCLLAELAITLSSLLFPYQMDAHTDSVQKDYASFTAERRDIDRAGMFQTWQSLRAGYPLYEVEGLNLGVGNRGVAGHHALMNYRYGSFLNAFSKKPFFVLNEQGKLVSDRALELETDWIEASALPAIDLLNLKYLLTFVPPLRGPEVSDRFVKARLGDLTIYENKAVMPPIYIFHEMEVFDTDEAALVRLADPDFTYRKTGTITGEFDRRMPSQGWINGREPITIRRMSPESTVLDVRLAAPGVLTFSEVYYPGWKVSVDGGPYEDMLCVDTVFRGVYLDDGKHTVQMVYRSESIRNGAMLSAGGLLILMLWTGWIYWERRRHRREKAIDNGDPGNRPLT